MTTSELYSLLCSKGSGQYFKNAIQQAMPAYRYAKLEKGRSAPVSITNEENRFNLTNEHILNLCDWYLNDLIDEIELEYGANLIEFSDDFEYNEDLEKAIFMLGTPEINGDLTKDHVHEIRKSLKGAF